MVGEGKGAGRVLPFANTTPRPNYKRLKHILLICGEFGVCILEPAFGLVELRLNEVIGLAVCRFLWDAKVSLERKWGKGLVFFSFQWRLLRSNGRKGINWKRGSHSHWDQLATDYRVRSIHHPRGCGKGLCWVEAECFQNDSMEIR